MWIIYWIAKSFKASHNFLSILTQDKLKESLYYKAREIIRDARTMELR